MGAFGWLRLFLMKVIAIVCVIECVNLLNHLRPWLAVLEDSARALSKARLSRAQRLPGPAVGGRSISLRVTGSRYGGSFEPRTR